MENLKIFGDLGKITVSERVYEVLNSQLGRNLNDLLGVAIKDYILCDWGFTDDEYERGNFPVNSEHNNTAVESGEGIVMAVYMPKYVKFNEMMGEPIKHPEHTIVIWIITEADRSKTTIMFPDEY